MALVCNAVGLYVVVASPNDVVDVYASDDLLVRMFLLIYRAILLKSVLVDLPNDAVGVYILVAL